MLALPFCLIKGENPAFYLCRKTLPPHIQGAVVEEWEQLACIDANEPVSLLVAEHRLIQEIIVHTGIQISKVFSDHCVLHWRNLEEGEGLGTSDDLIGQMEDQFTFVLRVTGVDKLRHIRTLHQETENVERGGIFLGHHIVGEIRRDRKVLIPPLLVAVIVGGCAASLTRCPMHQETRCSFPPK